MARQYTICRHPGLQGEGSALAAVAALEVTGQPKRFG
jgi:hypothetical protein